VPIRLFDKHSKRAAKQQLVDALCASSALARTPQELLAGVKASWSEHVVHHDGLMSSRLHGVLDELKSTLSQKVLPPTDTIQGGMFSSQRYVRSVHTGQMMPPDDALTAYWCNARAHGSYR
jgi:hypothetical protein